MKKFLFLLIVLLTGCSTTVNPPVEYVPEYTNIVDCGDIPDRPPLDELDEKQHIGSLKNITIFQNNINYLFLYTEQLENMLMCYKNSLKNE